MGKHTKWRLERKESLAHKLTKEHKYRNFTRLERGMLLSITIFLGMFFFAFGYYQLNVAPFLPGGSQHIDPFTQVWNGSITGVGTVATSFGIGKTQSSAPTNDVSLNGGPSVSPADQRFEEAFCTGALSSFTLSKISITLKRVGNPTGTVVGETWSGGLQNVNGNCSFNNIGQADFGTAIDVSTIPTSYTTESWTGSFGITSTGSNSFAFGIRYHCVTCDTSNYLTLGITNAGGTTNENGWVNIPVDVPGNCAVPTPSAPGCPTAYKYQYTLFFSNFCPSGYSCINSYADTNNLLTLTANSTIPGVALSKSPVDFSSAASKELFWFETWNNITNYVAQPIGWFLTTNQTLPTAVGYNPLNDPSVILVNVLYPLSGGKNIYYNYQSKTAGQSLLTASGLGTNPYPTCPQSSTLFICAQANINGGGFRDFSMTMNYTGTTAGAGSAGASLTCNESTPGPGPNTYDFCLAAYTPSPCTGTNAVACSTRVFPYLNVNAGPYYIGYWSAANQTGTIQFGTSNSGAFDRRANMAFVWVPNPCGGTAVNCTQSTTDTGGFFGWLGHTIGSTFNVVGNTLSGLLGPVLSFGGSLLGALYSGFVQAVGILIQTYVTVLNFVGNLLGLGNLGDLLKSLLLTVALLITNGLSTIVSWFTSVGSFLTSGWLTFLAGAAGALPGLLSLALTIWNFVFNSNFSVKTLLYADGLIMLYATYKKGLGGFFAWVSLNVFLFTFVFNLAWTIFDIITRPIHRTKETVDPVG